MRLSVEHTVKLVTIMALAVAAIYLLSVAVLPSDRKSLFVTGTPNQLQISDFVTWYEAGVLSTSYDRSRIYNLNVQLEWQKKLIAPKHTDVVHIIAYPPFFFTLMAPLSVLSMEAAYYVWIVIWPLVFLPTLYAFLKIVAPQFGVLDRLIFIASVVISEPMIIGLKLGQTNLWLATCVCLFYLALTVGQKWVPGAALALSSIKPQYSFFLGVAGLVWNWKVIIAAFVVEVILLTVAGLNVGWQSIVDYPGWLLQVESSKQTNLSIGSENMSNLRGLLLVFAPSELAVKISVVFFVGALLYLVRVWRAHCFRNDPRWAMAITLALASSFAPHLHDHDLILLSIAAALTLEKLSILHAARIPELPYRYWSLLLLYYPIGSWLGAMGRAFTPIPLLCVVDLLLVLLGIIHVERLIGGRSKKSKSIT
jgi:Protein of unknown function (DUF2029).